MLGAVGVGICSLPLLLPSGPGNLTPADVAFLVAMLVTVMWWGTSRVPLRAPYLIGVGVFACAGAVAGLAGVFPGLALLSVLQDLYLLLWSVVLVSVARTPRGLDAILRIWAASAVAWAVVFVVATTGIVLSAGDAGTRAGFTFGEQNGAGLYFALSLFVVLAARRPRRLLARAAAVGVLLLAMLYTGSLGALSGLLFGLAIATVLAVRTRRGAVPAVAVALALLLASASAFVLMERENVVEAAHDSANPLVRNSLGRGNQSSAEREAINRETSALVTASDLFGIGPAATHPTLVQRLAPYPKEAHNDWLAAAVERGALGVLGIALLLASVVHHAARTWNPHRLGAGARAALPSPAMLSAALGVVAVFSLTHEVLHDRSMWTLLGVIGAVSVWGRVQRTGGVT